MHSHFADPGLLRGDSDSDKSAAEYRGDADRTVHLHAALVRYGGPRTRRGS